MPKSKNGNPFLNSLRRINKSVLIFFLSLVLFLAFYEGVISEIPAPNHAFFLFGKAGKVIIEIFYSIVSGLIFYFFIEYYPKDRRRAAAHFILLNSPTIIKMNCSTIINEICWAAGKIPGEAISEESFTIICENIDKESFRYLGWKYNSLDIHTFIRVSCDEISTNISNLLAIYDLLDDNWLRSIVGIQQDLQKIYSLYEGSQINHFNLCPYYIWTMNSFSNDLKQLSSKKFKDVVNDHLNLFGVNRNFETLFTVTERMNRPF